MSNLDNVVRPFWLSGLNDISGLQQKGLGGLICDESYQIYSQVSSTSFILSFAETKPLLSAFAGDISRFGAASFESIVDIRKPVALRKSSAWLIVQTYYSAFFSAHAILRLMGESCSQLEREQVNSIHKVANLFGAMSTSTLNGGLYHLIADGNAKTISGTALPGSSHEAFWKLFHERILRLAADALTVTTESASNRQLASTKLSELASNLCFHSSKGSWLSSVRNSVNYRHNFGAWYPYSGKKKYYEQLFSKTREWMQDPLELDLVSWGDKDLRRFQITCHFLIAMLRSLINDMSSRCTSNSSFHLYGSLACLNVANQTKPVS